MRASERIAQALGLLAFGAVKAAFGAVGAAIDAAVDTAAETVQAMREVISRPEEEEAPAQPVQPEPDYRQIQEQLANLQVAIAQLAATLEKRPAAVPEVNTHKEVDKR